MIKKYSQSTPKVLLKYSQSTPKALPTCTPSALEPRVGVLWECFVSTLGVLWECFVCFFASALLELFFLRQIVQVKKKTAVKFPAVFCQSLHVGHDWQNSKGTLRGTTHCLSLPLSFDAAPAPSPKPPSQAKAGPIGTHTFADCSLVRMLVKLVFGRFP